MQANKWHGGNQSVVMYSVHQPLGITAIHPSRQPPCKWQKQPAWGRVAISSSGRVSAQAIHFPFTDHSTTRFSWPLHCSGFFFFFNYKKISPLEAATAYLSSLCRFIWQSALWLFYAANCWASLWRCHLVGVLLWPAQVNFMHGVWVDGWCKVLALVVIFQLGGRTLNLPIIFSPQISPVVSHTQSLTLFLLWLTFTTLDYIMVQWHTRRVLGFDLLLPCFVLNICFLSLLEWLPCVI